ncbi:MAG: hypothetical protein ACTSR5_03150 [Promethearchaeota archaeon]
MMPPQEVTPRNQRAHSFYSKIETGEIIVFIVLMIFSIYIEFSMNQTNKIIMSWMFVIIFLVPSILVYMLFWYYLRVDLNGITIFYRFHYKRIEWAEIIKITIKMRHQKGKNTNYLVGSGVVVFFPYISRTGGVQLSIQTSKDCIKTRYQSLRFKAINRLLHHITILQKYSIQRIDNEANERGRLYYYVNWEIKSSNSTSKQLSLNDRYNLYLRNDSGEELNQSLSWNYKLAVVLFFLGLIDLFFMVYIFLLGEFGFFSIFMLLIGGIGIISISILMSVFSPELRKIQEFQPNYHI